MKFDREVTVPRTTAPARASLNGTFPGQLISLRWWKAENRWVIGTAILTVLAQMAFRSWLAFHAWFQYDDLSFISRVSKGALTWHMLFDSHNSHLMPAGFLVTWVNNTLAPWTYWPFAAEMMVLQLASSIGAIVFLVSAFGRRPGILPPLAIFLFTVFTHSADLWWAVGVNQLPTLAVMFWGAWTHLTYLRTGRRRWAIATIALTIVALAFQERALLLFVVYAFFALAYFAHGDVIERCREVGKRYLFGVILYAALGASYLALYATTALSFDPGTSQDQPLIPLITEMGVFAVVPGLFGGPLRWAFADAGLGTAEPTQIMAWGSVAILAYLGYHVASTRTKAKRVWWLFGAMLGCQILLVAASRSFIVGPQIGRAFRYTTEMAPIAAMVLALAVLPLVGALETVRPTRPSAFLDRPARVAVATAIVCVLGVVSTMTFATHWNDMHDTRDYVTNARADLLRDATPVPLIDAAAPDSIWPGFEFAYPLNTTSYLFRVWSDHASYPTVVNDQLNILSQGGRVKPDHQAGPARRAVRQQYMSLQDETRTTHRSARRPRPRHYVVGSRDVLRRGAGAAFDHGRGYSARHRCPRWSAQSVFHGAGRRLRHDPIHLGGRRRPVVHQRDRPRDPLRLRRPGSAVTARAEERFVDRSFPTLDAVRAAGALMVVLTHCAFNTGQINHGWSGAALSRMDFGVALFFVVSGFLLARPWFLAAQRERLGPAPGTTFGSVRCASCRSTGSSWRWRWSPTRPTVRCPQPRG